MSINIFKKNFSPTYHCICYGCRVPKTEAYVNSEKLCICVNCCDRIDRYISPAVLPGGKYYDFIITFYPYESELKDSFLKYKFQNNKAYGEVFQKFLIKEKSHLIEKNEFDIATSVPLSKKRMRERGYNQTELVFEGFIRHIGIEYSKNAIFRIKNTKKQSGLSTVERNKNVRGAFLADSRIVKDKRVLIIDDIHTRGATMRECAKTLKQAGAKSVVGLAFMKTHVHEEKLREKGKLE